jgi:transposase
VIQLPNSKLSDVLTYQQLLFVAKRLPEPHKQTGRPAYSNLELLPGILKVLRSGCRWRDLDTAHVNQPSGITHWRRFRFWRASKAFKLLWKYLLKGLSLKHKLDTRFVSLDGTLIPSVTFAAVAALNRYLWVLTDVYGRDRLPIVRMLGS